MKNETIKFLKRNLKNKVTFTMALLVGFMMIGHVGYAFNGDGSVIGDSSSAVSESQLQEIFEHSPELKIGHENTIEPYTDENIYIYGAKNKIEGTSYAGVFGTGNQILQDEQLADMGKRNVYIIGSQSVAKNISNAVVLGTNSVGVENAISVGGGDITRKSSVQNGYAGSQGNGNDMMSGEIENGKVYHKIVNMAKGEISKKSHDAINGSQLYDLQENAKDINVEKWKALIDTTTEELVKGAGSIEVSKATDRTDGVVGKEYTIKLSDKAEEAIKNVDINTKNITKNTESLKNTADSDLGNITNSAKEIITELTQVEADKLNAEYLSVMASVEDNIKTHIIKIDEAKLKAKLGVGTADGTIFEETEAGIVVKGEEKTIGNIADGIENSDAVNVSQLKGVASEVNAIANDLSKAKNEYRNMGAMNGALSALKPMQYDELQKTQLMAGVGFYKEKHAVAIGLSHYLSENFMVNAGVAIGSETGGNPLVNAGFTMKLGRDEDRKDLPERYEAGPVGSVYIMQAEIEKMQKEIADLKAGR